MLSIHEKHVFKYYYQLKWFLVTVFQSTFVWITKMIKAFKKREKTLLLQGYLSLNRLNTNRFCSVFILLQKPKKYLESTVFF